MKKIFIIRLENRIKKYVNLLFGTLGSSAILILRTNEDAKNIDKILSIFFRIIPSFCM